MTRCEYVPAAALSSEVLYGLLKSFTLEQLTAEALYQRIAEEELKVFVVGDGNSRCFTAVSVLQTPTGQELQVDGLWVENPGQGWRFRTWLWFLQNLGREWGCDRVTTAVSDVRQLRGLIKNGCKVDYVAVSLEIGDGQQEEINHHLQ